MINVYKSIHPNTLFICTILCLPTVFFQKNIAFLCLTVILFIVLKKIKTGRVRLLPSLIIFISILFFNILTPTGKVLFNIGTFRITQGALLLGLEKACVLLAMVFISQFAISKGITVRGKIGIFINTMFYFFDKLTEHKSKFILKRPIYSIDLILLEAYDSEPCNKNDKAIIKQGVSAWLFCLTGPFICYTLLIVSILYR